MNLTFATRDMIRALRVLAPALSRSNQGRIYACQLVAQRPTVIVRAFNDTWEARSAIPATIDAPGEVWLPGDTLRRLPWGTLGETVRIRRVKAGLEIQSQSPTSETFTAEIMGPAATKGLPQGTRAAVSVSGAVLARLLQLGSIASLGKGAEDRAVLLYTSDGLLAADAWDGTWLSHAAAPVKATRAIRVALPFAAALSIAQAAGQAETVTIFANTEGTTLTLAAGASTLTIRVFAASFPNTTLIPTADTNAWNTDLATASLALAVRHALAVAGTEHAPAVLLEADGNSVTFRLAPRAGARPAGRVYRCHPCHDARSMGRTHVRPRARPVPLVSRGGNPADPARRREPGHLAHRRPPRLGLLRPAPGIWGTQGVRAHCSARLIACEPPRLRG